MRRSRVSARPKTLSGRKSSPRTSLPGNPAALLPRLGQTDGDGLLAALDLTSPATAAASGRAALVTAHLPLDLGSRAARVSPTTSFLASTPLCHLILLQERTALTCVLGSCGKSDEIRSRSLPERGGAACGPWTTMIGSMRSSRCAEPQLTIRKHLPNSRSTPFPSIARRRK
jgi:hypothetical protein